MLTSNRRHAAYSPNSAAPPASMPSAPSPNPSANPPPEASGRSTSLRHKIHNAPCNSSPKKDLYTRKILLQLRDFASQRPPAPAPGMPAAHSRLPWAASSVHSNAPRLPSPSRALIAVPLNPRRFAWIRFASQNPHLSVQTKAKQGLIYTQDIPPAPRLCVTTLPAPASGMPAAYSRLPRAASPVHSSTPRLPSPAPAFKIAVSITPRRFA